MDEIEKTYVHKELSGKIIGAAMEVLNVLKPRSPTQFQICEITV